MRTYLITGSSRSGTSLVAGLLHKNSISMGGHFTPASFQNPRGFYEDLDFVNFNANLLRVAGGDFATPPTDMQIHQAASGARAFLDATIAKRKSDEWGVKDPRITWLWDLYSEAFKGHNPRLIITRRNILNTARSLVAAAWAENLAQGIETAARFDARLTEIVSDTSWPVLELHFEQWRKGRRRQEERLEAFVGREMDFESVQCG